MGVGVKILNRVRIRLNVLGREGTGNEKSGNEKIDGSVHEKLCFRKVEKKK